MDVVTKVMVFLGDICFAPLSKLPPAVSLWIVSALIGAAMLVIWKYTSNQDAIADVRARISANLLASRLFKDNLAVTFRAQRQILLQALRLMLYSIQPMLIMLVPFVLIMVQIGVRYEFKPLEVGEPIRVTVTMKNEGDVMGVGSRIELPPGITANANDPCRAKKLRTIDWRLTPAEAGDYVLVFGEGEDKVDVPIVVGSDRFERVSMMRGGSFIDRLLYSTEPDVPHSSKFESVRVAYDHRTTPILFDWELHWLLTLLILSIVFALLIKPFTNVKI